MNEFLPLDFFLILRILQKTENDLAQVHVDSKTNPVQHDVVSNLDSILLLIEESFEPTLGIDSNHEVHRRANRLRARLRGHSDHDGGNSNVAVQHEVRVLRESIEHAYSERLFFCMPSEHATFYDQPDLFRVASKFSEANKEIKMAGTCYSIEAYTACVFHLTRVVEIAARLMIESMGVQNEVTKKKSNGQVVVVPVKLATWEQLRTALDKGLDQKRHGISTDEALREDYEFYNHAISQFAYFKEAWRNKVSHKRKTYLQGETTDIMNQVKQFMVHISQRLSEPAGATFD